MPENTLKSLLFQSPKPRLVLATHNAGKIRELTAALSPLGWDMHDAAQLELATPDENGGSFDANALLKAKAACNATGMWALADDSGLEVDALNGAPGVDTAHYGGWEKLLVALKDHIAADERGARFVCVLALVSPEGEDFIFKGTCAGTISPHARGTDGFGYDPVFVPHVDKRTFAEMSKDEKAKHSHRGQAVRAMLQAMSA